MCALSFHSQYSHCRVGIVPVDSSGRSIPVGLPNPQASSFFCIFWTGAFGLARKSAGTLSRCHSW